MHRYAIYDRRKHDSERHAAASPPALIDGHRAPTASGGTETDRQEVRPQDRLQHDLQRVLHDPVTNRRTESGSRKPGEVKLDETLPASSAAILDGAWHDVNTFTAEGLTSSRPEPVCLRALMSTAASAPRPLRVGTDP